MKVGRMHLLKRGVMAAAAIGMLVVAQPSIAAADHDDDHLGPQSAGTPKVLLSVGPVPVGAITVPAEFQLCVGTRCFNQNVAPGAFSFSLLVLAPEHSNAVAADADPVACPTTASGEQLLGARVPFSVTGGTGGAAVSGGLKDSSGNVTPIGPINVPPGSQTEAASLRLCALSPVA